MKTANKARYAGVLQEQMRHREERKKRERAMALSIVPLDKSLVPVNEQLWQNRNVPGPRSYTPNAPMIRRSEHLQHSALSQLGLTNPGMDR